MTKPETVNTLTLNHFSVELDKQKVAWLCIDTADSQFNRLSSDAMQELGQILDHFSASPPAGLIIYSGKESGFIAGADINEFSGLHNGESGLALVARGWKLFERLAAAPYPTLALIGGHCLGGGLELAMACRYRLAVDQPDTRLSLPEVMLGIFPGWGGIQRLPRLVGPVAALDMMLTGRPVNARRAAALGLVDAAVPPRLARQAAAQHVISGKAARSAQGLKKLLNHPRLKPLVARKARQNIDKKDPHHHYAAPRMILDMWLHHDGNALKAPEQIEELTRSDTTRNLLRVFHLQERLKEFGRNADSTPVGHVHIIGAGIMGGDIAAWSALKGLRVTVQDQDRERIAQAQGRAIALFRRRLKDPRLIQAALDRLIPDPQGYGLPHADLVLEAITENMDSKRALYQDIEHRLKPDAVLATNTSSLSVHQLSLDLQQPEHMVGIHFFNPVASMPLVEIIETDQLDPSSRQKAYAFVRQLDKLPLPVNDAPGFLVNAVLAPYMLEAMHCVDEGMTPATVDQAMLEFGMPMGPLELADTVGLDIVRDAGAQLATDDNLPACLRTHLDRNELGKKNGRGFYLWTDGKVQKGAASTPVPGLTDRLIQPLIAKAQELVDQNTVADADLADAGVIFGTGFAPFRGGPLHYQSHTSSGSA